MSNLTNRVKQLEGANGVQVQLTDEERAERILLVMENPTAAAAVIGADGVARVFELIDLARARKEAARE